MCFFAVMSRSYYLFKRSPSFECNVFPHKIFCFHCRCRHHTRVTNDYNGAAFLTSPNRSYHLKITSVSSPKSSVNFPSRLFPAPQTACHNTNGVAISEFAGSAQLCLSVFELSNSNELLFLSSETFVKLGIVPLVNPPPVLFRPT